MPDLPFSILLLIAVLVVTWICSVVQEITRTRRFLVFMVALSAVALLAIAVTGEVGTATAMYVIVWGFAWLAPTRLGLGHISRTEAAFDRSLRPIYRGILAVPARDGAAGLLTDLGSLTPPTAAWARVHALLADHLGSQLDHANEHYLPDRWRVVRAREIWDRTLVRNILGAHRQQTPAEFDAQLSEALAPRRPAHVILSEIEPLRAPTPAWAQVQEALVHVLEEDLMGGDDYPGREVGNPAIRELQRLWAAARQEG